MNRRLATVSAGIATLVLAAAACGVPEDDGSRAIAPDELPASLTEVASTTTAPERDDTEVIQLYYVRDGELVPTIDSVPQNPSLNEVLQALTSGPDEKLANVGFRSPLAGVDVVRAVTLRGGVATVDLTAVYVLIAGGDQVLGLAEIVLTLTARPGVGQVRFTLEGQPIEVPRADGTVGGAVSRDDYVVLVAD